MTDKHSSESTTPTENNDNNSKSNTNSHNTPSLTSSSTLTQSSSSLSLSGADDWNDFNMRDVSLSVVRGIREAEKKLDEASHAAYSLPNVVGWLPVVGPVIRYISHSGSNVSNSSEFSQTPGQTFDLKKKN